MGSRGNGGLFTPFGSAATSFVFWQVVATTGAVKAIRIILPHANRLHVTDFYTASAIAATLIQMMLDPAQVSALSVASAVFFVGANDLT